MWHGSTLCHSIIQYQSQVYTTLDTLLGSLKPCNLSSCNITVFPNNLTFSWDSSNSNRSLNFSASCVRPPHAFLIGNLNFSVTASQILGHIQCKNCTLHACVDSSVTSPFKIMHHSPFAWLSVSLNYTWTDDNGLALLHLALEQIHHPKRFLGALILGIVSLIIASMTTAVVTLTQQIQTAHYVNTLTKNVSNILHSQNDLNRDLQQGILKLQEELTTLWSSPIHKAHL
jgi:hypothetical protein